MKFVKTIFGIALSLYLFLNGCAHSYIQKSENIPAELPIKSYLTFWYLSSDSTYSNPIDTLSISLTKDSTMTLEDSPFGPPGTTLNYNLKKKNNIALQLYTLDAKETTRPIKDTLKAGSYKFLLGANNMKSGIYFWRRTIGEKEDIKKIVILK